jgi:hypothetical protein
MSRTFSSSLSMRCLSLRKSQLARRRFSSTVSVGKTLLPPGIWTMPSPAVLFAGIPVMS